jgi:photosystem II PsbM protein
MNWFDRSDIHNIELIQYYQNGSRIPLFPLHGITSRVIVKIKNKDVMDVNILIFIAIALFILIPSAFSLIIYVKTARQND